MISACVYSHTVYMPCFCFLLSIACSRSAIHRNFICDTSLNHGKTADLDSLRSSDGQRIVMLKIKFVHVSWLNCVLYAFPNKCVNACLKFNVQPDHDRILAGFSFCLKISECRDVANMFTQSVSSNFFFSFL